jgi:hypothetical protein
LLATHFESSISSDAELKTAIKSAFSPYAPDVEVFERSKEDGGTYVGAHEFSVQDVI